MKIAVIGLGAQGRAWLNTLLPFTEEGSATLAGVVESIPTLRDDFAAKEAFDAPTFATVADLIAHTPLDAAIVATPPPSHFGICATLLDAGCHVLCEKPLATTLSDVDSLVRRVDATGRILMVGQNYRYRAPIRTLQRLLATPESGELVAVDIHFSRDSRTYWPAGNFRFSMDNPLLIDMSIHHLDLICAVTGRNATAVAAMSWGVPDSGYHGDPALAALIQLEGAVPVTYRGNWAGTGGNTSWNTEWNVLTTRGRFALVNEANGDGPDQILWTAFDAELVVVEQERILHESLVGLLDAFLTAITTGQQPETSAADNRHSLALLYAVQRAIETGTTVSVG